VPVPDSLLPDVPLPLLVPLLDPAAPVPVEPEDVELLLVPLVALVLLPELVPGDPVALFVTDELLPEL
jgi:hypothetical protein